MPAQPARSVVTARPPASTTASATAEPTAPAAPVMRMILSLRRPMEADYRTMDDGRRKSDHDRRSAIMMVMIVLVVIVTVLVVMMIVIVPVMVRMGRRDVG